MALLVAAVSPSIVVTIVGGDAAADAGSDLEKAHSAYLAHKYDDAEKRLRVLLDPQTGILKEPDATADARMYLGAVLIAQGKKDAAAGVFEQLLLERPEYQPDPLRVALAAIDALIDARTRLRERLQAIAAEKVRRAQEERARVQAEQHRAAVRLLMLEKLASEERTVERASRWRALLPFGVGQFENRQTRLGWLFLGSESLCVAGSVVGAAIAYYNVDQMNGGIARQDGTAPAYHDRAVRAANVANAFAVAFGGLALTGIVHAELTFVPEHVEVRARALPPISYAPFVGPGTLGVAGRF